MNKEVKNRIIAAAASQIAASIEHHETTAEKELSVIKKGYKELYIPLRIELMKLGLI